LDLLSSVSQEAIQQIERDVTQLNEMFHDLNYLVQEQQVGIDNIETNISVSKQEATVAHKELSEVI
jgi:t-SNARE complex subunit (syntaxin)